MTTACTRVAAVIGCPVHHSLSPALHNAAFAAAGIDAIFVALQVAPADLAVAVAGFRASGFLGVSVTIPHKEEVLALCDWVEPLAHRIGAVNCLRFEGGGRVAGYNTDARGFTDALIRDGGVDPAGRRAVLLGGGGAARAVHAGLEAAGAAAIEVIARRPKWVPWIIAHIWNKEVLDELLPTCDILADCTSAGLDPEREQALPAPIPLARLPRHAVVTSLVYHREPTLLTEARTLGFRVSDGRGMLVYQGARAFELWTGRPAPVEAMRAALSQARPA